MGAANLTQTVLAFNAVLSAVMEEFKRAAIYGFVKHFLPGNEAWKVMAAGTPGALEFAFGHWWTYSIDASLFVYLMMAGYALVVAYAYNHRLGTPIVAHIVFNLHMLGIYVIFGIV
jgi:membrane protease YdiL (CAAX protease family)